MRLPRMLCLVVVGAAFAVFWGADATLPPLVCYRLPFSNPNLADGWGSTCCGRTNPHRGVDFPQATGTNIPVIADGTVVVRTSTSCLGNVVVIQHADGMFSGYAHMQAQSPLALGAAVTRGQHIGKVGATGTCQTGPHLHLTLSSQRDGYFTGTTVDPYAYIMDHVTCDRVPTGALDDVDCQAITGTALDPDDDRAAIAARVSFGGPTGASDAIEVEVPATVVREADCAATQPCAHGFVVGVPAALKDDVARPVYAYGVDAAGRAALLTGAPQELRCAPPAVPDFSPGSVRRRVDDDVLGGWGRSAADVVGARRADVAALPEAAPLGLPSLVAAADGLFVHDDRVLRRVDDATLLAWGLDAASATVLDDATAAAALRGAPWPAEPFFARGGDDDDAVFFVDAPPPLWALAGGAGGAGPWPRIVETGAAVDVAFGLVNRGSLAWSSAVTLVAAADGDARSFCDSSWSSLAGDGVADDDGCDVVARVASPVAPGDATTLAVRLRAPATPGPRRLCVALQQGAHAFVTDDLDAATGPAWCATVLVVSPPLRAPLADADGDARGGNDAAGAPPAVSGGCAATDGSSTWLLLVALGAAAGRRRRRGATPCD